MAKVEKNKSCVNGLKAQHRIKSKILADALFLRNTPSFLVHPILVRYHILPAAPPFSVQMMVVVSKKRFKNAVHRNRIKRLLRETYRIQKPVIATDLRLIISYQFIGNKLPKYAEVAQAMQKANQILATLARPADNTATQE